MKDKKEPGHSVIFLLLLFCTVSAALLLAIMDLVAGFTGAKRLGEVGDRVSAPTTVQSEEPFAGDLTNPNASKEVEETEPTPTEPAIPSDLDGIDWDKPDYSETFAQWIVDLPVTDGGFMGTYKTLPVYKSPEEFAEPAGKYFKELQEAFEADGYFTSIKYNSEVSTQQGFVLHGENSDGNSRLSIVCSFLGSQEVAWVDYTDPYKGITLNTDELTRLSNDIQKYVGINVTASTLEGIIRYIDRHTQHTGLLFVMLQDAQSEKVVQVGVENYGTDNESWSFSASRVLVGEQLPIDIED